MSSVKGGAPAARRRCSAATIRPGAERGASAVGEVVHDVGMRLVQRAGRRVVAIALLGDGQRHDSYARVAHGCEDALDVHGRDQHLAHAADDAEPLAFAGAERLGVEAVLGGERVARVGASEAHADDAPGGVAGQHIVGEDRLVRAVERADAEMHDAGGDGAAVVGRAPHVRREAGERLVAEARERAALTDSLRRSELSSSPDLIRRSIPER